MTTTRPQRDATANRSQAMSRTSRITNRAGITMVGAAAGRRCRAAQETIFGARFSPMVVCCGA